jgi:hypothetical protein
LCEIEGADDKKDPDVEVRYPLYVERKHMSDSRTEDNSRDDIESCAHGECRNLDFFGVTRAVYDSCDFLSCWLTLLLLLNPTNYWQSTAVKNGGKPRLRDSFSGEIRSRDLRTCLLLSIKLKTQKYFKTINFLHRYNI